MLSAAENESGCICLFPFTAIRATIDATRTRKAENKLCTTKHIWHFTSYCTISIRKTTSRPNCLHTNSHHKLPCFSLLRKRVFMCLPTQHSHSQSRRTKNLSSFDESLCRSVREMKNFFLGSCTFTKELFCRPLWLTFHQRSFCWRYSSKCS